MHTIKPYETSVTLFGRGGGVWTYPSKKALLRAMGIRWIMANVGINFRVFSHASRYYDYVHDCWRYERTYTEHGFVLRDDTGAQLTHGDFDDVIARRKTYRGRWAGLSNWNGEGPVPGVHRPRRGHYFRRPQSTNERRRAIPLKEEGEPAPRAARNGRHLPNSWDDYSCCARYDRNWKRFRKQQWKARC